MEMVVNGKGIKEPEDISRGRGSVPGQPAAVRRPGERSPASVREWTGTSERSADGRRNGYRRCEAM